MSLEKQINAEYIQAMKSGEKVKSLTLNFLRAQLKNLIIDKKVDQLSDEDVIGVIKKQVKQRKESIEQYQNGGRGDLAEKEKAEWEILQTYLPEQLSQEKIKALVDETIVEINATSMKDMGAVMKGLMPKIGGRADNTLVSAIVKETLNPM